jgi:hypothetical protein
LATILLLTFAAGAQAQAVYPGGAPFSDAPAYIPSPPRDPAYRYDFTNQPPVSVNRSYLGYTNLSYYGLHPPAPGYMTDYRSGRVTGYYTPVPSRRRLRLFQRW